MDYFWKMEELIRTVAVEDGVFARLMYKHHCQHRRGMHWKCMNRVRRFIRTKNAQTIKDISKGDMSNPEAKKIEMETLIDYIATAAESLQDYLKRGHFQVFALTMFACLSRMYILRRKLLYIMDHAALNASRSVITRPLAVKESPVQTAASDNQQESSAASSSVPVVEKKPKSSSNPAKTVKKKKKKSEGIDDIFAMLK
jgi:hypothetical protein